MEKIIKLLNKEIDRARSELKLAKKERSVYGMYDDCGDFYHDAVVRTQANLGTLIYVRGLIKKETL